MESQAQDLNSLQSKLEVVQTNLALQSLKRAAAQDASELKALANQKTNLQYKIAFAKVMASGPNQH